MFRYIAFAWDESHPASAMQARQLSARLHPEAGWSTSLAAPGLRVLTSGAQRRMNGSHALPPGRGVVVGKLFRRCDLGSTPAREVVLTGAEVDGIVDEGGHPLVRDFWGRYVAFIRTPSGSTCVLRDPSGTLPCFLIRHEGIWLVFSWLEDVLALLPAFRPGVCADALLAHLLQGELGGRETPLEGVMQVIPGEAVHLGSSDLGRSGLLWDAVGIARSAPMPEPAEAAGLLRTVVRSCAEHWASCHDGLVLRLSGGLDSSILLACLADGRVDSRVVCLNHHSRGSDSDERRYARLAATRAGRPLLENERDAGHRLDRILEAARTPSPVNPVGWMNSGKDNEVASAHSATALFTGAGGDQLFFEFASWWPAADYLRSHGPDAGFLPALLDAARLGRVSVWRAAGLAVVDRLRPNLLPRESVRYAALLGEAATHGAALRSRFVHPSLVRTGLPIGKDVQTRALMHPVGCYDPFEPASAPELVNPLLSQPLVEMCLGLPTYLLTRGGRGRALARRAFAADLPQEIATRRSKGGLEEHLGTVLSANIDFARGMLLDGELVRRRLIEGNAVADVLSGRPSTRPGHCGQVHALLGIEAWLRRWPP